MLLTLLSALLCVTSLWAACEPTILLDATTGNGRIQLTWKPAWFQTAWQVESSDDPLSADWQILAVTQSPEWTYLLSTNDTEPVFFRVRGIDGPELPESPMLEDFERMPLLLSLEGEDLEPDGWEAYSEDPGEGDTSLRLFGNTVKRQLLGGGQLDSLALFEVSAFCEEVSDRQMIGFADSLNTLWYVIWGERGGYGDTPGQSGQVEISSYQGWFPTGEWVSMLLPVAADWRGKFGYQPELCELLWANECDATSGSVRFDALRDRTALEAIRPRANPVIQVLGQSGDSLVCQLSADEIPGASYTWSTGDGRFYDMRVQDLQLLAGRDHSITLLTVNENGLWGVESLYLEGGDAARSLRIGFAGDIMTARSYEEPGGIIETLGVDAIFDSVRVMLNAVDLMQANLECAYTTAETEHPTKSITFKSAPQNLDGVMNAGINLVTLANNHTLDWMEAGMLETVEGLDERGIPWLGSGLTSIEAERPVIQSWNGLSVGVLASSDRTGNYNNYQPYLDAGPSRPGFALWSRAWMGVTIPELNDKVDLLVLQIHSGNEYSTQPTESRAARETATGEDLPARLSVVDGALLASEEAWPVNPELEPIRWRDLLPDQAERNIRQEAIDLGADLVITHHPHILQGVERYQDGLIAHSMGNFVMDLSYLETMPTAMLDVQADNTGLKAAWIHPVFINRDLPVPCRGSLANRLLDHIAELSRPFETWVLRQSGSEKAWVALDTAELNMQDEYFIHTIPLEERDGWFVSPPVNLGDAGFVAGLELLDLVAGAELRTGSNRLWWGGMEDEGADIWDINSSAERYTESQAHSGTRSIEQELSASADNRVYYITRAPHENDHDWTLAGWVKCQDAASANLQMRYYETRTSGVLSTDDLPPLSGNQDWSMIWQDLITPEASRFGQVRLELIAGDTTAMAWFDDVSLVEWMGDWQALQAGAEVLVPAPGETRWIQVRIPAAITSLQVQSRHRICLDAPVEP